MCVSNVGHAVVAFETVKNVHDQMPVVSYSVTKYHNLHYKIRAEVRALNHINVAYVLRSLVVITSKHYIYVTYLHVLC